MVAQYDYLYKNVTSNQAHNIYNYLSICTLKKIQLSNPN